MKKTLISAIGIALLAFLLAPLASANEDGEIDGQAKFLAHRCVMCHSVAAEDLAAKARVDKMKGPDLSGFKSRATFPDLASFLRGEVAVEGKKHTRPFKGTDEELQAIVDWLASLEPQE